MVLESSSTKKFSERVKRRINHIIYDIQILFRYKYPGMFYKENILFYITEVIRQRLTGWSRNLIWCPSQLEKTIIYNDKEYTLYGRWRWDDPWTGHIIINKSKKERYFSQELLSQYDFKDYQIRDVERTLDKLFRDAIVHKKFNIEFQ